MQVVRVALDEHKGTLRLAPHHGEHSRERRANCNCAKGAADSCMTDRSKEVRPFRKIFHGHSLGRFYHRPTQVGNEHALGMHFPIVLHNREVYLVSRQGHQSAGVRKLSTERQRDVSIAISVEHERARTETESHAFAEEIL